MHDLLNERGGFGNCIEDEVASGGWGMAALPFQGVDLAYSKTNYTVTKQAFPKEFDLDSRGQTYYIHKHRQAFPWYRYICSTCMRHGLTREPA